MRRLLYILLLIGFYSVGIAQITVNTNFTPNISGHIDSRCVLTNLSDTSTIAFKYEGMLIYIAVPNKFYYYETYWKELASEELIDSYVSDNGFLTGIGSSNKLPVWGGSSYLTYSSGSGFVKVTNGNISYDNSTYLTSEVDGSTSNEIQRLDTFEIYETNKLRISLEGDGQPYKTVTLPAGSDTQDLSLDSLSRVFTLTLVNGGTVKWRDIDTQLSESQVDSYVSNNGYLTSEVDGSTSNEVQTLSADSTSTTIGITSSINNSRVHFNVLKSEVDGSITNEIQDLSGSGATLSGYQISLSSDATPVTLPNEADGSITNEIELPTQTGNNGKYLQTNGTSPSWQTAISGVASSNILPVGSGATSITTSSGTGFVKVTAGDVSYDNNTYLTTETDGSITNELQTLSLTDSTNRVFSLVLSSGNTVKFQDQTGTLTAEQVQDYVGAMMTGNTENNMNVDYQDSDGTIDFNITMDKDIVANAPLSGGANNVLIGNDSDVTISADTTSNQGLATKTDTKSQLRGQSWCLFGDSFSDGITGEYGAVVKSLLSLGTTETHAVSGNKISQQLTVLNNLLSSDPTHFDDVDIVSLLVGVNDFAQNTTLGTRSSATGSSNFAGYLKDFIETLLWTAPTVKLFIMTPPEADGSGVPYQGTNTAGWTLKELAVLINQICTDYSIQCIDLYSYSGFNYQTLDSYTSDRLHPNSAGSTLLGEIIARAFEGMNNGQTMQDEGSTVTYNDKAVLHGNSGALGQDATNFGWDYTNKLLNIGNTTTNVWYGLEFKSGSTMEAYIKNKINTAELKLASGRSVGWGGSIRLYTDETERMVINSSGNVLINALSGADTRFVTASLTGQLGTSSLSLNGVDNRVALWSGSVNATYSDYFTYDRANNILGMLGSNKLIFAVGSNANTSNPWASFNDQSGYLNLNWFSKYDGSNWVKTTGVGGGWASRFRSQNGTFYFSNATADGAVGSTITWQDILSLSNTGMTALSLAGTGSALTKVSDAGLFSRATSGTDYDPSITNEIQNLSYTASTRVLAIDGTGSTDATLPLFTSTEAGLVPLSGGGTTNFLRADGTWAATSGSVTTDKDLVTSTPLSGGQDNILVGTDSDVTIGLKAKVYEFAVANDSLVLSRNATLTNNALLANHATIGSTGILFEGSSADGNETLLTATNPTADRTIYLPNAGTNSYLTSYTSGTANFIPKLVDNTNFQFTNSIISESSNTITATSSILDLNILTIGRQFNYLNQSSYSNTGYSMHYFNRYRGSLSTPSVVTSGDILGTLSYTGYDGTNLSEAARVDVKASGTISTGIVPSTYEIYTKTTTNGWNPRIAINNTGGITMSSLAGSGSRTVVADANGLLSATDALGTVTSIATNNGITGGTITTTGTIGLDYTATPANNPTMQINETRMASNGVIFEGATANTIETLLTVADPTSLDKTITLPDATGTVAVSASAPLSNSATGNLTISQATTSTNGYLSSTDWNVFNNKQNALTNPVTGTGVATYVPRWTGTNTLSYFGNFTMTDDATNINLNTPGRNLRFNDAGSNIMFPSLADASSTKVAMIGQSTGQLYASAALYYNATEYGVQSLSGLPLVLNKAGNNIGVGKLPSVYFDVNGAGSFVGDVKANATGSGYTHSAFWGYSTSYYRGIGMYYSGNNSTWYTGNPYPNQSKYWGIYFKATANDAQTAQETYNIMRIDSLGNLNLKKLDSDLTAPATSGKKNVLISDASGNVSFRTSAPITRITNFTEQTPNVLTYANLALDAITFEKDTFEIKATVTGSTDSINIKVAGVYEVTVSGFAYMITDVTEQYLFLKWVKGAADTAHDFIPQYKIPYNKRFYFTFTDVMDLAATDDLELMAMWDSGTTNCRIDDLVVIIKRL